MTTLISVHNSDGCCGRCDANCYNATGGKCDCVCGGRNHGVGLRAAMENTREMSLKELQQTAEQSNGQGVTVEVNSFVQQLALSLEGDAE